MKQKKFAPGIGCAVLFALPFAIAGVVIGLSACRTVFQWRVCSQWNQTTCTITAAKLVVDHGGDSTSNQATATYNYFVNGKRYESDRVALSDGSDSIGSFQRDKAKELRNAIRDGGGFQCFVDPHDPSNAILFRELRPLSLVVSIGAGLLFGGVGFGLILGSLWWKRDRRRQAAVEKSNPTEPWMWRADWADQVVSTSNWKLASGITAFAVFWNLISWSVFLVSMADNNAKHLWFVAAFPLVGLALAGSAVHQWARHWVVKGSKFRLASVPGVVGGYLSGAIQLPRKFMPQRGFLVTLSCVKKMVRETSDGSETWSVPIWQQEKRIIRTLEHADGRVAVPVRFAIPSTARSTSMNDEREIWWELQVFGDMPLIKYSAIFDVPVFRLNDAEPEQSETDVLADYEMPITFADAMLKNRIAVTDTTHSPGSRSTGSIELRFSRARNLSLKLAVSGFAVIWSMISIGAVQMGAPLLFRIVFPGLAVVLVLISLNLCLRSLKLTYSADQITIAKGVFPLISRKTLDVEDVKRLRVEESGTRSGRTVYQRVAVSTDAKRNIVLASGFARLADANRVARSVAEVTKLKFKERTS